MRLSLKEATTRWYLGGDNASRSPLGTMAKPESRANNTPPCVKAVKINVSTKRDVPLPVVGSVIHKYSVNENARESWSC